MLWVLLPFLTTSEFLLAHEGEYPPSKVNVGEYEAALKVANEILGSSTSYRLVEQLSGKQQRSTNDITVQLVRFPMSDQGKVALVPYSRREILVDMQDFATAQTMLADPYNGDKIESKFLLAIFLLHEVGHIDHQDYLKDPAPSMPTKYSLSPQLTNALKLLPSSLNTNATEYKNMEDAADLFAGETIRHASNQFEPAFSLAFALARASANMQSKRIKDHFGGFTLRTPEVLADPDIGHPNLELRLLRMNYYVSRAESARKAVEDFEQARTNIHFVPETLYSNTNANSRMTPTELNTNTPRN